MLTYLWGSSIQLESSKIINGVNVYASNLNWNAIVSLRHNKKHFCSGYYIGKRWVLTAAHCVTKNDGIIDINDNYEIFAGSYSLTEQTSYTIETVIVHEHYISTSHDNDIALLQLNLALPDTDQAVFISEQDNLLSGTQSWVAGWGTTDPNQIVLPDLLQEALVPIVDKTVCSNNYSIFFGQNAITQNMLCAGYFEGGIDSCQGDSGGPLIIKENNTSKLIGIVSWGAGCAEPYFPGIYTNVQMYLDWIKKKTAIIISNENNTDILLQDKTTGYIFNWSINNEFNRTSQKWFTNPNSPSWNNIHAADMDQDGSKEYILQHDTLGYVKGIKIHSETLQKEETWIGSVGDKEWKLVDVIDLNGDGYPDCLFQHAEYYFMVWEMKKMSKVKQHWLGKSETLNLVYLKCQTTR